MQYRHYLEDLDYSQLDGYLFMLCDQNRTDAYRQAIEKLVDREDHIVEIGAGPGVFGRMAAKLGRHVTLIEQSARVSTLCRLANDFFASENVTLVKDDIKVSRIDKADVIIHEILGGRIFDEGIADILIEFSRNNRWVKEEKPIFIPSSAELWYKLVYVTNDVEVQKWDSAHYKCIGRTNHNSKILWVSSPSDFEEAQEWRLVQRFEFSEPEKWIEGFSLKVGHRHLGANAVLWGFVAYLAPDVCLDARLGTGEKTSWGGTLELLPQELEAHTEYEVTIDTKARETRGFNCGPFVQSVRESRYGG